MFPVRKENDELNAFQLTSLSLSTGIQGIQQNHFQSQVLDEIQETSPEHSRNCENWSKSHAGLKKSEVLRSHDGGALKFSTGSSSKQLKNGGLDQAQEQVVHANFGHAGKYYENNQHKVDHVPVNASEVSLAAAMGGQSNQIVQGISSGKGKKPNVYPATGARRVYEMNGLNKAFPSLQSEDVQNRANGSKKSAYHRPSETSVSKKLRLSMITNRKSAAKSRARRQAVEVQKQLEITELLLERCCKVSVSHHKKQEASSTVKEFLSTIFESYPSTINGCVKI